MHIRYFNIGVYMLKTWTRGTSKTLENLFNWVQLIFSKNLSKDRVYSLNRSVQSFLTRFPLFKMLTRLPPLPPHILYLKFSTHFHIFHTFWQYQDITTLNYNNDFNWPIVEMYHIKVDIQAMYQWSICWGGLYFHSVDSDFCGQSTIDFVHVPQF